MWMTDELIDIHYLMDAIKEITVLSCPSCGAIVETVEVQLSSVCYFCDAAVVKTQEVAPHSLEEILPFKVTQRQASASLQHTLQNHWFLPNSLKKKSGPDDIQGMFVPFWVLKATARSNYDANIGINYQETETYTEIDSNGNTVTKTRTVTRTDWHHLTGSHVKQYEDHIICASKVLSNAEVDPIEPFDFGQALQFTHETVAGWRSEIPVTTKDDAFDTAVSEIHGAERIAIRSFLTGDSHRLGDVETKVECKRSDIRAALLPIWIATYTFKGQSMRLLVNGQTGTVGGEIPRDWKKIVILIIVFLLVGAAIVGIMQ